MSKFIDGVHELYHVQVVGSEVEVQVKMYDSFWDEDQVAMGNAFKTRQEAEYVATQIRDLFKHASADIEAHKEALEL